MGEDENNTPIKNNQNDILKAQEKVDVYRKTPLIRTTLLGSIVYEAGNMVYHFIAQKNSLTSYVNENVNFFNNTIVSTIRDISNYAYENTGLSILIASGIGFAWYWLEKARGIIPKETIAEVQTDSEKLELVKDVNYELDKKHYFIQDKIQYYANKYVKPFVYGFMGISAGVSVIGGTYGAFIKNGLNVFKNFPQVADSYSALLLTAGAGVGFFSLRKFSEYASNLGRGVYEKYLFVDNKINSLEHNEKSKEIFETAKKENKVVVTNDKVKDLVKKLNEKNRLTKQNQNPNQNKQ